MSGEQISIREMQHTDYETMARWLNTKEVWEFFGNPDPPLSLEEVQQKYGPRIGGEIAVLPFIAEREGRPIGFLQYYELEAEKQMKYGYPETSRVYGIDQFIGVPHLFGQGIGTAMVKEFIALIDQKVKVDVIVLDPAASNMRAIKCYEKCGFVKVGEISESGCVLMELEMNKRSAS